MAPALGYRLGLPAWAYPGWRGRYFAAAPSPLASYSSVFNCVEGNTTFYRIPDAASVAAWADAVAGRDFEFCFKLPSTVTHARPWSRRDARRLFRALAPLGEHLGPFLVQFPAHVGPADLPDIEARFAALPADYRYVIEVRHPDFFEQPERLYPLIERHRLGRVVMDTRALYRGDRQHPEVVRARHEKPDLPIVAETHNALVFVRLVLHPDDTDNQRYLDDWAARGARCLDRGERFYMLIHCPNNLYCPALAVRFHTALARQGAAARPSRPLPDLAPFPVPWQQPLV